MALSGLILSIATGIFLLLLVYWCIHLMMKRKKGLQWELQKLGIRLYDHATIVGATRGFSNHNQIGRGAFGPVYKGTLAMGQEIAIKRLSQGSRQGAEEFKTEAFLIAKVEHQNIVKLLGCCIQSEEMILVYEYMENKSLDRILFDPRNSTLLTWPMRYNIIIGVSRGLLHLHQESSIKIIHRDIKANNILLDNNLEPKISDFGLARTIREDQTFLQTKRIVGTRGYIAPEYINTGQFSEKSDIFSLGVLLLEIISGKKNTSFNHPDHSHDLLGHAWLLWNGNKALDLIDTCFMNTIVGIEVMRCIQVGLLCVQNDATDRPEMSAILSMLCNEVILPQPKQPAYFSEI